MNKDNVNSTKVPYEKPVLEVIDIQNEEMILMGSGDPNFDLDGDQTGPWG